MATTNRVLPRFRHAWPTRLALAAFAALILAGCGEGQGEVVARSNLGVVTRSDLEAFILALPEERQRPGPNQSLETWRLEQLERLLVAEGLAAEADDFLDEPEAATAIRRTRLNELGNAFSAEQIDSQLDLSDEAVRRYYDEHADEFGNAEQIRLSHIFRRVDREASPAERAAARAEMEGLLTKLRGGANFGELARDLSDSETAHRHGLIGRLDRGALEPELEAIVWNLDEGGLSEVVSTPVGFHIFRLDKKIPPTSVSFEEARERLRRRLEREGRERLENEHFERLLAESGAVYRPELVEQRAVVDPETSVFELEDYRIRIADVAAHVRTAGFLELRRLPPDEWLRTAAMARLFAWKAREEGLDDRPEVKEAIARAERDAKIQIAAQHHLDRQLDELEASGELEAFYDEHHLRFQTPTFHRIRVITMAFDNFPKPYDAYERLEGIAKRIRSGALDMEAAAREYSDELSAPDGGDLGWVRLDAFGTWYGPRVQNRVVKLSVGELSEPLLMEEYDRSQLRYQRPGYVLVRIEEIRPSRVRTFEEARQEVRDLYVERHRRELDTAMRQQVLESIHADIVEENL